MAGGQARAVISIRELSSREEFEQAVELQRSIWAFSDFEVIPVRFFVVASKIGGQVLGAFDGDRMVAFLLAVPGLKPGGGNYLHSHMLGVLPEFRDAGLGRKLKLRQRDNAISRGIPLIEWTFDPLEPRNAFFNIHRLGVIVRRYVENQYGRTTSALHAGLPTDRFVAEWWLQHHRVQRLMAEEELPPTLIVERLSLPLDITEMRARDPLAAREIQKHVGTCCQEFFAKGLAITGFERGDTQFEYLFSKWE